MVPETRVPTSDPSRGCGTGRSRRRRLTHQAHQRDTRDGRRVAGPGTEVLTGSPRDRGSGLTGEGVEPGRRPKSRRGGGRDRPRTLSLRDLTSGSGDVAWGVGRRGDGTGTSDGTITPLRLRSPVLPGPHVQPPWTGPPRSDISCNWTMGRTNRDSGRPKLRPPPQVRRRSFSSPSRISRNSGRPRKRCCLEFRTPPPFSTRTHD